MRLSSGTTKPGGCATRDSRNGTQVNGQKADLVQLSRRLDDPGGVRRVSLSSSPRRKLLPQADLTQTIIRDAAMIGEESEAEHFGVAALLAKPDSPP